MKDKYPTDYENNNVLSVNLGFDTKNLETRRTLNFGVGGEIAFSNWHYSQDVLDTAIVKNVSVYTDSIYAPNGEKVNRAYLTTRDSMDIFGKKDYIAKLDNKMGIHADAYLDYEAAKWEIQGKGNFVEIFGIK